MAVCYLYVTLVVFVMYDIHNSSHVNLSSCALQKLQKLNDDLVSSFKVGYVRDFQSIAMPCYPQGLSPTAH